MRGSDFLDAMSYVDPALVEEAASAPAARRGLRPVWAAAAALLLLLGSGLVLKSLPAQPDPEALSALPTPSNLPTLPNLPTPQSSSAPSGEPVTRALSVAFYPSPTGSENAKEVSASLSGLQISQSTPTDEELAGSLAEKAAQEEGGVHYRYYDAEHEYSQGGGLVRETTYLEKWDGQALLWRLSVREFSIHQCIPVSQGVLVLGATPALAVRQTRYAWAALVSEEGELLWQRRLENGFHRESLEAAVENADGTFALFSRGDSSTLCFTHLDRDGELLQYAATPTGETYGVRDAAALEDGYLVQLGSYSTGEYARLLRLDADGTALGSFALSGEDCQYVLTHMRLHRGLLYLSGYAFEPAGDDLSFQREISPLLEKIFAQEHLSISSEELTPMVREIYTAVLFVWAPGEAQPRTFYAVPGSLGGSLAVAEGGDLLWDVESISSTYLSLATSSFTIGGASRIWRYSFSPDGTLSGSQATEEAAVFRR